MSMAPTIPTQDEFLAASTENVSAVAPRAMVYAPGGTRRSAMFAGIEPWSEEYLRKGEDGVAACLDIIFRHGVQHVFMPAVMVGHAKEVDDVEQQLIRQMGAMIGDPYLLNLVNKYGWRLRIAPSAYTEVLRPLSEHLERNSPTGTSRTWWLTITPSYDSWWSTVLALAKSDKVQSRSDAIVALFGEDVPPITLCLAFGKPMISPDLFPPLLMDNVHCYWSQQAGLTLTEQQFRKVLYDYAFLRQTWQKDKTARAKQAGEHQQVWEREMILGLGQRLGPFWYPQGD
jgi:hypothetical protein